MKFLSTNILITRFIALTLSLGFVQFVVLWWNHFPDLDAFFDGLHTFVMITGCGLILRIIQFSFHTSKSITFSQFGLIATLALVVHYSSIYGLKFVMSHNYYLHFVYEIQGVRYVFVLIILICISLFWWIAKNAETQEKISQQLLEQERAIAKAELVNINNQLQPHFLFNSLNSISALTMIEPKEANRMIHLLSDFLRGTLRKDFEQLVAFNDELSQANLFLEIEKVRFGNRLHVDMEVEESSLKSKLPALIIQPLLENALKHGLSTSSNEINVHVEARLEQNHLYVSISNPYEKDNVSQYKGTGYGIQSVQRRLQLFYGQNDCLKIARDENLFTVQLRIPQIS